MAVNREKVNANRRKSRLQAIKKAEAKLRKRTFFDPTYDIVFKKLFEKTETLVHFLNAILHLVENIDSSMPKQSSKRLT